MTKYFCKACDIVFDMDEYWDYSCGICGFDYCSSECFNSDLHDDIDDDVIDNEDEDE